MSLVAACAFVVGGRLFPDPPQQGPRADGESRRRGEIREYLGLIDEPFAENHFVEGHTVDFYLPKRDVAITFDARAFLAIDDLADGHSHAVLVEHELPGMGLGRRLPFETPEVSVTPDEEDGLMDPSAFAHLGLPTTADRDEIREAYREQVKTAHPDHGGDPETFRELQEAYASASEQAEPA
nr:J domain-containing protein [Halomarina rubra]